MVRSENQFWAAPSSVICIIAVRLWIQVQFLSQVQFKIKLTVTTFKKFSTEFSGSVSINLISGLFDVIVDPPMRYGLIVIWSVSAEKDFCVKFVNCFLLSYVSHWFWLVALSMRCILWLYVMTSLCKIRCYRKLLLLFMWSWWIDIGFKNIWLKNIIWLKYVVQLLIQLIIVVLLFIKTFYKSLLRLLNGVIGF